MEIFFVTITIGLSGNDLDLLAENIFAMCDIHQNMVDKITGSLLGDERLAVRQAIMNVVGW